MAASTTASLTFLSSNSIKTNIPLTNASFSFLKPKIKLIPSRYHLIPRLASNNFKRVNPVLCSTIPSVFTNTTNYEFSDGSSEVELRLELGDVEISTRDIFVDTDENSLLIRVNQSGTIRTLMDTSCLYGKIKPSETIWYIDDNHLVVSLKKQDPELNWPDIVESWESLTVGVMQLLKGTSIYIVGESTEINQKISEELAVGLGYTPLETKELLEAFTKQTVESCVVAEGSNTVAEAESSILESLSSHARTVVATLGGKHGAARRTNKWRHLFAGFSIWLFQSEATDEHSARDEVRRHIQEGHQGYSNAEVVVKLGGWDAIHSKTVAQASLSALKRLILSDKKLPGKKSLYIRLGCRGDWPDIKPPAWDPSNIDEASDPES